MKIGRYSHSQIPALAAVPVGVHWQRVEFAHLLRGIAAGSVLTHHFLYTIWNKPQIIGGLIAQPALPALIHDAGYLGISDFGVPNFWGHFGVALFFLISGFVIPFSVSSLSPSGFIIARALRIWPTYVVGLSITLGCLMINANRAGIAFPYTVRDVLSHYLILPRWPSLAHPIDGIIWSLEIELFFYGFCLLLNRKLKAFDRSIYLIVLLSVPFAIAASSAAPAMLRSGWPIFPLVHWASSMLQFLPFLLVGTSFHYFYRGRLGLHALAALDVALLGAFILSWRFGLIRDDGWSGALSYLIAFAAFAAAFVWREAIGSLPQRVRRPFARLADISYPLYVVHGILGYSIIVALIQAGFGVPIALALAVTACAGLATGLHFAVERPSQALGKSLATRRETAMQAPQQQH